MSFFDEKDLSALLKEINEFYGNDIMKQHSIRALIEYYFKKDTVAYFKFQFTLFAI